MSKLKPGLFYQGSFLSCFILKAITLLWLHVTVALVKVQRRLLYSTKYSIEKTFAVFVTYSLSANVFRKLSAELYNLIQVMIKTANFFLRLLLMQSNHKSFVPQIYGMLWMKLPYLPSTTSTDLLDGPQYITHLAISSGGDVGLLEIIDA